MNKRKIEKEKKLARMNEARNVSRKKKKKRI